MRVPDITQCTFPSVELYHNITLKVYRLNILLFPFRISAPYGLFCCFVHANAKESSGIYHTAPRTFRGRHPETKFTKLPKEKVVFYVTFLSLSTHVHTLSIFPKLIS